MPVTGTPYAYVDVTLPRPVQGGLIDSANVINSSDPHTALGGEYTTFMCGTSTAYAGDICTGPGKLVVESTSVTGRNLIIVAGIKCKDFSSTKDSEYATAAQNVLKYSESKIIEQRLIADVVAAGPKLGTTPEDITTAIGHLEEWLDGNYLGQGMIHMSRELAVHASKVNLLSMNLDGRLATYNGTPIVNGRGYYRASGAEAIFATGQVTLISHPVVAQGATGVTDNITKAIAERMWVILVECGWAFVEVTLP